MGEDEARALAAKREAHKSKHMTDKRWAAIHDSVKGWHVALIGNHKVIARGEYAAAKDAFLRGDFNALVEHSHNLLMARVRAELDRS